MVRNDQTQVLIAGAGPTGLMTALWLTRSGVRVRVVDPKPGPTLETRAIAVQARTLEFYDQLGLGQEALLRGRHFDQISLWVRGRPVSQVQLQDVGHDLTPHPYLYILTQDQNEAMLLLHLEALGVKVEWNTTLSALTQDGAGVTATLQQAEQTQTLRVAYLTGCGGARSTVRQTLGINFHGGTYPQMFYVADVTATGKLHEGSLNMNLDDARLVTFFPIPGQNRFRIVGLLSPDAGEQPTFEAVRPDAESHGMSQISEVHWFATYRVHHRVAEHFRAGRAFLLGDAAHVHSPAGGQGMNTGLGDAVNLAWKLAQVLRGAPAALLDTYQTERAPFAYSLVATTDWAFSVGVNPSSPAQFIRTQAVPRVFPILTRFKAVRRMVFLTVSQIRLSYPNSTLSVGQAGALRGGQRLPWVPTEAGSNYDALTTLDWQMHVYGAPSPELLA